MNELVGKRVTAKRLGWDEQLSDDQLWDLDDYEHETHDLEGELEIVKSPLVTVYLVGGQEADSSTIEELVENAFCPTGPGGGVDPTCGRGTAKSIGDMPAFKAFSDLPPVPEGKVRLYHVTAEKDAVESIAKEGIRGGIKGLDQSYFLKRPNFLTGEYCIVVDVPAGDKKRFPYMEGEGGGEVRSFGRVKSKEIVGVVEYQKGMNRNRPPL